MILTAQLPVSRWHEQIGDPTLADGILDRLVHNAHPQLLPADEFVTLPPSLAEVFRIDSPRMSIFTARFAAPSWSLPQHPRVDAPIGSAQNVWESRIDCHRANACGHGRARAIPRTGTKKDLRAGDRVLVTTRTPCTQFGCWMWMPIWFLAGGSTARSLLPQKMAISGCTWAEVQSSRTSSLLAGFTWNSGTAFAPRELDTFV